MLHKIVSLFKRSSEPLDMLVAIRQCLAQVSPGLVMEKNVVAQDNRHAEVWVRQSGEEVGMSLWENGMVWHQQDFVNAHDAAAVIHLWCGVRANSGEIEKAVPGVVFPVARKMIEQSNEAYLKWHWQSQVENKHNTPNQQALLQLLAEGPVTGRLMVYRQLWDIGLSCYIGEYGEYLKNDLVRATVTDDYVMVCTPEQAYNNFSTPDAQYLYKGDAPGAYEVMVAHLPEDLAWATYQTVEEYRARIKNG